MGNYLRIYKNLEEFKANTFNLPYPCVSVVDDDTIETDEEIVEFEQLDKLSFKVEVPTASTECVNVASFSNSVSVEGYSFNGWAMLYSLICHKLLIQHKRLFG